ncbi:hypothetical protein HYQ46_012251 [Verticillium longisporum]|nr:hypothetical protein HYQ46_012251 [Verticillium longisporum]
MRRARNSRSVRRPPRRSIQSSSSERSDRGVSCCFSLSLSFCFSVSSTSKRLATNFLATSGERSPRATCLYTLSGITLESDFEYDVSFVRNMTSSHVFDCATLAPSFHDRLAVDHQDILAPFKSLL